VREFYQRVVSVFEGVGYDNFGPLSEVLATRSVLAGDQLKALEPFWKPSSSSDKIMLPHFHYRLTLEDAMGPLHLYVMVPPRPDETLDPQLFRAECSSCAQHLADVYGAIGAVDTSVPIVDAHVKPFEYCNRIPVEMQVRIMLADTMAEQYHGTVYKVSPPKGTQFPRRRMNKVAVELDILDKEMEMDFEDHMNRYESPSDDE
jgi:hypothetical protein